MLPQLAVFTLIVLMAFGACSSTDEGAIPITTTSSKARSYFLEGRDLLERFKRVEAHEYFKKALAEDSLFALAYLNIANTQPSARAFFESFAKAKELVDSVSEGERLLILTTDAAIKGDQAAQMEYLTKLISLYPKDARAHNLLGQLYFGQQRFEQALELFNQSIAIAPDYSPPDNLLGYSYRYLGELEKAADAFKKYTDLIPDDPNPHDSYAELLLKKGDYKLSIESYRRALALDPGFVESYIGVASNLCYQGKHKEARDELQQLYAVARNDGERRRALYGIAATYVNEGIIDSAMSSIFRARKLAEQIEDVRAVAADYSALATLELERDNFAKAYSLFDSAASMVRESDLDDVSKANTRRFHLFNLARVALETGKLKEADSLSAEFAKSVSPLSNIGLTALSHQLKGMIALKRRDFENALSELGQANPRNPYNRYRLALAYQGQGDLQKAKDELRVVVDFNSVLEINYALIRGKAKTLLDSLTQG